MKRLSRAERLKRLAPYRSGLEQTVAQDLVDKGIPFEYEKKKLHYEVPAALHVYTPDFELPNGIIIEAKGRWTAHDRKKMVLVMEQHPELDIRMLFERNHPINKGAKTRYADFCQKRGIKYAVGKTIPTEWLEE